MNGDAGIAVFAGDNLFLLHGHGGRELGGLLWFIPSAPIFLKSKIHLLQNSLQGWKLREGGFLEGYMVWEMSLKQTFPELYNLCQYQVLLWQTYGQGKGGTSFLEGTSMTGNKHYSSF
ncbi:hypothetical protein KY290_030420 [Solanum tuberosum]|uniref:Uncharacterized protein n=1 Tax=Solanum tuberosum TaxID=4113 RepID=A0ABQ7UNK2_SOLTU|nr:hypothetical protein KY289_028971 [Solanum tuberosum]KAH0663873.1 hypothetical protein KY284_028804 [Solanum tuberosum]KAH0667580.1 hypothetical protein KY285_028786 [Solanum tuberosum]KAH0751188.1 hypothetical protein KY290_030420 [Solanum tuberosum]